uniref:NAD-dependent protein deacetylase Sirt2 n=1 Tax=Schistosoma haematobium TaxID=6185 RepID=A0A095ATT5_SCHHA
MVGAGVSTAAGIPDFRSPSSGIYDNLEDFNLPTPNAIFSIDYFRNCDSLERLSGLPEEKLVEAHGTFHTGHCIKCKKLHDFEFMLNEILAKRVPKCLECKHVVKPGNCLIPVNLFTDVVLFGESMPKKFFKNLSSDLNNCDLLIIMGTSLTVLPFCAMIHRVGNDVPRLYINREYNDGSTEPGLSSFIMRFMVAGFKQNYMKWGRSDNERDIFWSGNADDGVVKISELLGWKDDLLRLKEGTDSRLNEEFIAKKSHDKILTKSVGND